MKKQVHNIYAWLKIKIGLNFRMDQNTEMVRRRKLKNKVSVEKFVEKPFLRGFTFYHNFNIFHSTTAFTKQCIQSLSKWMENNVVSWNISLTK